MMEISQSVQRNRGDQPGELPSLQSNLRISLGTLEPSAKPTSLVNPSLDKLSSSDTNSNMKLIKDEKEKWILLWNGVLIALFLGIDLIFLTFFSQCTNLTRIFLIASMVLTVLVGYYLYIYMRYKSDQTRKHLLIALGMNHAKLYLHMVFF